MVDAQEKLTRFSVEYNLTEHCNLSCYLCDHASPLLAKKFAVVEEFVRDLEALASVFHSTQLRIVGGEPTLHPQLLPILSEARRIGIADNIVLLTNGVQLHRMPAELWELIDDLWISVYPGVNRRLDDDECARLCEAHKVRLDYTRIHEFDKTLINNRIDDPALVGAIFAECKNANEYSCHTVYDGRFYRCSIAPFMGQRLALRGTSFDNREIDGVALHGNANLRAELESCLNGRTPLAACSYCLGTSGPKAAHRQLNRQGRALWLEEDNSADIEFVREQLLSPSKTAVSPGESRTIPILAYHSIAEDGPPELLPWRITPGAFKEQLCYLQEHGYRSISLDEWADCIAAKTPTMGRPVVITFDDGYESVLTQAAPLLEAAGFRATVFVVTDRVGATANWDTTSGLPLKLMSWDDLRSLKARGFSIGSHTTAHLDLTALTNEEIERDSREARAALRRELGHEVTSVAFPGGTSDARVRAALVRGGYRIGVEIADRRSTLSDDIACLPRIEILAGDDIEGFARKLGQEDAPVPAHGAVATGSARSTVTKLFTAIYNDMRILGHFLEHYSQAGITEFFIATDRDFRPAIESFGTTYNITVVETAEVADHFIGGAAAVTGMRRRFQGLSEWAVIVDLDEFVEFADDLPAIIEQAEREGANVVRAVMWDRFSRDGQVAGFEPGSELRQVFPIRARFINKVMLGADHKGVLVKGQLDSEVAHHSFVGEVVCSRQLDLSHYKWFDGALDRVRDAHRMLVEADKPWAVEYQRALEHYARNGRFAWEQFGGEPDPFGAGAQDAADMAAPTRVSDDVSEFVERSAAIPGWTRGADAEAVAHASLALGDNAVIVEVGVFLGSCTVLLAGPRRRRGNGLVHCVDPFDGSGDAFSVPHYRRILDSLGGGPLRRHFDANIARTGLGDWVDVHEGRAVEIAANWTQPIDLLLLDGDQSPEGARAAYEAWAKFLKPGGILVLRNTAARDYAEGHDGHRRLALAEVIPGRYDEIRQLDDTTIARKLLQPAAPAVADEPSGSTRERPRVHLYAQCWNDEFMLPFFFRHYDSIVDRYVIFDDGSTDRSLQILADHPKVELRRFVRSDPNSFVLSEQALSNACWKESRGEADWVIVTDLDEHLYHPKMREYLGACAAAGVTLIPALGFQMVCDDLPGPGELLSETSPRGAPFDEMMKPSIFNPDAIAEMNFRLGRHTADPTGDIQVPDRDEVLLLHYKYVERSRTLARHRDLLARLGSTDADNRWGHQYAWSGEEMAADWRSFSAHAVDVRGVSHDNYPLERWWHHETDAVSVAVTTTRADQPRASGRAAPGASARIAHMRPRGNYILYVAEAFRASGREIDISANFFELKGNDFRLRPPPDGCTQIQLDDIAPGVAGAVFSCALALYEGSAAPVRFRLRLWDHAQTVMQEAVINPGECRAISLLLDGVTGQLSIEFQAEMANGQGRNAFAWATCQAPRLQCLSGIANLDTRLDMPATSTISARA